MRAPPPRITNLALLVALLVAFASGVGAVAAGTASGRWVAVAHGVVGVAVVLLVPWKSMIVRRGLRRARRSRWVSLLLAALAVTALLTGLGSASGLLRSVGGFHGIWLHVATALALVPLVVWHVLARPAHAGPGRDVVDAYARLVDYLLERVPAAPGPAGAGRG